MDIKNAIFLYKKKMNQKTLVTTNIFCDSFYLLQQTSCKAAYKYKEKSAPIQTIFKKKTNKYK